MELLQLRYFCTVARMQNISHAASCHNIPQPAMSKTISKLERELGVALFERERNKIRLTPKGQSFYRRVAAAFQELDGGIEELRMEHPSDTVRLRVLVTALRGQSAEFLALFRRRCPRVTFQVCSAVGASWEEEPYDLCISAEQPSPVYDCEQSLVTRQVDVYVAFSADHPFSGKDLLTVEDLRGVPVVGIGSSPILQAIKEKCYSVGFSPNVVITCDDLQCLQRYIRSGVGVAFVPPYSWPDMGDPQIRFAKLDVQLTQQIRIFWSSKLPRDEVWFTLVEQLQQHFNPTAACWQKKLEPPEGTSGEQSLFSGCNRKGIAL